MLRDAGPVEQAEVTVEAVPVNPLTCAGPRDTHLGGYVGDGTVLATLDQATATFDGQWGITVGHRAGPLRRRMGDLVVLILPLKDPPSLHRPQRLQRHDPQQLAGFQLSRANNRGRCEECHHHLEQTREQERAAQLAKHHAEKEAARQKAAQQRRVIEDAVREQVRPQAPKDLHRVLSACPQALIRYFAMRAMTRSAPSTPLPSSVEMGETGWMSARADDDAAVGYLLRSGAAMIDPATPQDRFAVTEDGDVLFDYATVNLRLTGTLEEVSDVCRRAVRFLHGAGEITHVAREQLGEALLVLETDAVIRYLDGLLVKTYGYPPTPLARRTELAHTIREGYACDYTLGQMVCLAWRAADTAAAWKERNAGMGPPEAVSAAVTALRGKLNSVRERHLPVPEYDMPGWLDLPPALPAAQHLHRLVKAPWNPQHIAACTTCDFRGWAMNDQDCAYRCAHPDITVPANDDQSIAPGPR